MTNTVRAATMYDVRSRRRCSFSINARCHSALMFVRLCLCLCVSHFLSSHTGTELNFIPCIFDTNCTPVLCPAFNWVFVCATQVVATTISPARSSLLNVSRREWSGLTCHRRLYCIVNDRHITAIYTHHFFGRYFLCAELPNRNRKRRICIQQNRMRIMKCRNGWFCQKHLKSFSSVIHTIMRHHALNLHSFEI